MNKNKMLIISIMGVFALVIFIAIYSMVGSGDDKSTPDTQISSVPVVKAQDKFTYQDMMKYRENNEDNLSKGTINVQADTTADTLNFKIAGMSDGLFSEDQENDESIEIADSPQPEPNYAIEEKPKRNYTSNNSKPTRPKTNDLYNVDEYKSAYEEIKGNKSNDLPIIPTEPEPVQEKRRRREGFVGSKANMGESNASISVISFGDQLIESGGMLKMRVTKEATIKGVQVPRNAIVYGVVSQGQNRLNINVSAIQIGGRNLPVQLLAYDASDGMAGLKVTQQQYSNEQESLKNQTGDDIMNATGLSSLPIIGTMSRGAKDLLTRRKSNNTIVVTNNYHLILR